MYQSIPHSESFLASQAAAFSTEHAERIAQLSEKLLAAASEFLSEVGKHHFPAQVFERLVSLIESKDIGRFQLLMRNNAISSAGLVRRAAFWELNDAMSFLGDAVGTQWRYMTIEKRAASLQFADQGIEAFSFLMTKLDADPFTVLAFEA